jgi:glycine/D-amino acid oxidase-like deaminating enzyme
VAPDVGGRSEGTADYRSLSLWWDAIESPLQVRPPLRGDLQTDVCIVGAGFTGLWTAHALSTADPSLRVAVVEAEVAGFGASGRNGGWCSALFATSDAALARRHGFEAMLSMRAAMRDTVDVVGATAAAEGIDCHFTKGGTLTVARTPGQRARAEHDLASARQLGMGEEDLCWLDADETGRRIGVEGALGATFTPHCAVLQPALLARGLADAVTRRGVSLFETTPALAIEPRAGNRGPRVRTPQGTVTADVVVEAVEAWRPRLRGQRRTVVPVYSLMVATEPLPASFWADIGLRRRETFADFRHTIIYGQRTADDRLAFGGRGAPYHYGSAVRPSFDSEPQVHAALRQTLAELFPPVSEVRFTHAWGGPLAIPRDWHPSVGFDQRSGLAWAGGYVGDGVATSNLAGRTLAHLILGHDSDLAHLAWVNHRSKSWEPEPLRWLGVNAGLWTMQRADRQETSSDRPGLLAARLGRLLGE